VFKHALTIITIPGILTVCSWSAPVITNASFETPVLTSAMNFTDANPADVTGWTHAGSVGDGVLWGIGYTDGGGNITVAGAGKQFVTMGGGFGTLGTATWSQSVSGFTIGTAYDLTFMLAGEGTFSGTQTVTAKAQGVGSTSNNFNAPMSGANYWRNWQSFTLPFTADATTETISFSSTTQFDVGLDNVGISQVQSGVPEPSTWGLFGAGAAVLALVRRRLK